MNFGRRPSPSSRSEVRLELVDRHPVGVHLDLHDPRLVGVERGHRPRVGGGLGHDRVARIDERLAHQIDHLLAAGRHDHLVRIHRGAFGGHHLKDALDSAGHALGRAVLECARRRLGRDLGHQLGVELRRERPRLGQAAGQRDHLGPFGQGHHVAHRRGAHPARALGERPFVALQFVGGRTRGSPAGGVVYRHSAPNMRSKVAHGSPMNGLLRHP